ncbi:hypothetical protein HaLaN_23027, partial [Haematococcus lacustris]
MDRLKEGVQELV